MGTRLCRYGYVENSVENSVVSSIVSSEVSARPVWKTQKGLPDYQIFPFHIRSYLCPLGGDDFFIRAGSKMELSEWPGRIQSFSNDQNVEPLFSVDAIAYNLSIRQSTIKHPISKDKLFATTDFNVGD